MQVRFRSPEEIEEEAKHLLASYTATKGWDSTPPVPIEKLIRFLGLSQEVVDLYSDLGVVDDGRGDLLGAITFDSRTIKVHSGIDPEEYPWREGRFNFTLAHETGHWVLHRDEHAALANQRGLFDDFPAAPLISKRGDRALPVEIQANRFAACLLLPRDLVTVACRGLIAPSAAITPAVKIRVTRAIAKLFCTSIEATGYRLDALGVFGAKRQASLDM